MKETLSIIAKDGLPGKHHFYISFKTDYPGVDLPDYLRDEYPDNITIVLQYEFWDLEVGDKAFSVTLCFNEVHERVNVPFGAVISFVDPSVKFGLQFAPAQYEKSGELLHLEGQKKSAKKSEKSDKGPSSEASDGSNIIPLDTFRRK
jgi:uncharacterized protein